MSKKNLTRTSIFELEHDEFSFHTSELSREMTKFEWKALKRKCYEKNEEGGDLWIRMSDKKERGDFCCRIFSKHGITFFLEHNQPDNGYDSYYLRLHLNPRKLLDQNSSYLGILPPEKGITNNLRKAFHSLLENTPFPDDIDEYKLTRLDLCVNVRCDNKKLFRELIRVTAMTPTPYGLKRKFHCEEDKKKERLYNKHYIHFSCGSYELVIYDKTYQMEAEGLKTSFEKLPNGVLRYELRLKRKMIHAIEKNMRINHTSNLLEHFLMHSKSYLLPIFCKYFPPAYHYREVDLINWLSEIQDDNVAWFAMRDIYREIKRCGSDGFSLEDLPYSKGDLKKALGWYASQQISAVPLRKNFSAAKMPNFTMLLYGIAQGTKVRVNYIRFK